MILYFVRHGIAEDGTEMEDSQRKLTKEGVEAMHTAARVMKVLNIKPAHIFSSPRVRSRQTAGIIADALGVQVEIREEVNYGFNLQAVEALVDGLSDDDDVMFVGHEPSFSDTLGELTGGKVVIKKGGLARVDLYSRTPLHGALAWLIAPKLFQAIE